MTLHPIETKEPSWWVYYAYCPLSPEWLSMHLNYSIMHVVSGHYAYRARQSTVLLNSLNFHTYLNS